ncbi:unnamed protein product [Calypogeia fissa]
MLPVSVRGESAEDLIIDGVPFGGISKAKLDGAITNLTNLNYLLKAFQQRLHERGVELDIQIRVGSRSIDTPSISRLD